MKKILSYYIASHFILPFVLSTIFFVMFLLTFELFKLTNLIIAQDVSLIFILTLVGDISITLLPMAIPISIFFSAIYAMGKMSSDSEYVAMKSFGLSKKEVLTPFLLIGIFIGINSYFLGQELVPLANKDMRQKVIMLSSESLIAGLKSGQFFTGINGITLFPSEVKNEGQDLSGVFISVAEKNLSLQKFIFAKSGKILYDKNSKTGIESLNLELRNGNITELKEDNEVEKILFDHYVFPMTSKKFSYNFRTRENMMNFVELKEFLNNGEESAIKLGYDKKDFFNAKFEFWNRIYSPIVCVLFSFLGFNLGIKKTRGKNKNSAGVTIIYLLGYYIAFFGCVSLARDNNLPVSLLLIIPPIVLLVLGIRLFKNLDWQS